jgi:hypothetical protein
MNASDELANLRRFLETLKSGTTTIRRNGKDVTAQEVEILEKEIAYLEKILAQYRARK